MSKKKETHFFFIWRNFSFRVHDILVVYECHTRWIGHLLCAWESEKFVQDQRLMLNLMRSLP